MRLPATSKGPPECVDLLGNLAELLRVVYAKRDRVLADLAAALRDGEEGADLVLEDAHKERELL